MKSLSTLLSVFCLIMLSMSWSLGQVTFVDMAHDLGVTDLDFTCGVGIVDIDGDGISEIITATHIGNDRLYKWVGNEYEEMGQVYGLAAPADYHHQIALTDIDKDYIPDIFISGDPRYGNHGHLYLNRGHPPFIDVAGQYNVAQVIEMGSSFFQFSPNSELAFLCGGRLMVRTGGTFIDLTEGSGLESIDNVMTPIFFDLDGDNDDDLFIGGNWDINSGRLYRNNGDTTFTDISTNTNENGFRDGGGVSIGDYNGDGSFDIYLTSGNDENSMWFNDGTGYFYNETEYSHTGVGGYTRGSSAGDFDNDGDLDIFINRAQDYNILFLNDGTGVFEDVGHESGVADVYNGGGCAISDLNNDGQLDIVAINLDFFPTLIYINQNHETSFLKIKLIGRYPNTLALGAIVKLYGIRNDPYAEDYIGMREVRSVSTIHSFDDPIVHFGTGNYDYLRVVTVFNSLAVVDTTGITPGQEITIVEPDYVAIKDEPLKHPEEIGIISAYPNPFNSSTNLAIQGNEGILTLEIYDTLGRLVKSDRIFAAGKIFEYNWDGTDNTKRPLSSGIYFAKLESINSCKPIKITLIR